MFIYKYGTWLHEKKKKKQEEERNTSQIKAVGALVCQ